MKNKESEILKYGALSVQEMTETDPSKLDDIKEEMIRIERYLGLSPDEIIVEASKITSHS